MLPSSLRASHSSSNTGRKPAADSTRSLRFSDEEEKLWQPAVLSLRSRDAPPTNSSEKLKIRLNEAVANMEANERIEVNDKRRRASGKHLIKRERSPTPVGKDELALRRRRKHSGESWESNMHHSSSDSPSPTEISHGSDKRMCPVQLTSERRLVPRGRGEERALVLQRSHSSEEDAGKGRVERWSPTKDVMVVERGQRPVESNVVGKGDDEGRYLFKKQRKMVRRGEEWWVMRREIYAYWKGR